MEAEESVEVQAADGGLDVEESPVEPTSDSPTDEHVADVEPTVDVDQSPVSEIEVVNDSVGPEAPEPSADQPEVAEEPAADELVATEESAGGPVEEVEEPDAAVVPQEPPRPSGAPPTFITELTNVEFSAGNALMLMAQVTGDPVPDASWTRNGETIDLSGRVAVENDSGTLTLTVTLSDPRDAGQYCVVAYNEHGRANSEAEVILQKPPPGAPVFTENVVSVIQLPTGSAEFSARITGQPKPKVHWQFNDKPIKAGASYKLERDEDLCTLHIPECGAEMAGRYACVAKNSAGLARSEATLQVVDELPVEKPTPAVVEEPAVQTPSTQPLHQDQAHQAVASSETSAINPSKPNGEAPRSAADEPLYEPIQRPAKPASKECPFFLKTIGDTEVFSGMQARFTACVTGSPPPEYEWCRNGIRIYPSERIAMDMDNTGVIRLVMRNVDSTDAGRYKLRVYNQHGEASCEADLTYDSFDVVKTRPLKDQYQTLEWQLKSGVPMPLVDPPIISRMTDCQLTLSWRPSPPAGQPIPVTYQVEMSEPSSSEWSTIRTGVRGCSIEVKHLQPDKDYRFHIKVENKYGVSEPSSHVTTQRDRLLAPLEYCEKFLPAGERFRPDLSTRFPKDFDMERWNRRRPQPPTFLVPESNIQSGVKDTSAELKWLLFGYPIPDVHFSFNNAELDVKDRFNYTFTKDGNLVLNIDKVQERDQGVYEAIATNKYGEARQRVILQLAVRPRLTQLPEETTVMNRSQARLEVRVVGSPTPEVTWYKDWERLMHSDKVRILWREPETSILLVNGCTSRDSGLYSVSVRNKAGTTTASVMLHVEHDETNFNYQSYSAARSVRPRNKAFEDFYDIGEELGRGTQGITYHVVERSNGRSFAAKCMNGKGDFRLMMNNELWVLNQLYDRELVRLYDAYESPRQLILVEELCSGGDVLSAICEQPSYNESDVANVVRQVLWALQHMHGKHVAHLGLTPGDILFSRPGGEEIKICDFSFSRHINPKRPERLDYGMPEFVGPEIVNGESVSLATDMWAVGVITYLLLSGTSPFRGETDKETLLKIQSGDMQYDLETFSTISDKAKDFIAKLLVFCPAGRMDVKDALKHPWLKFADRTPPTVQNMSTDKLKCYMNLFRSWYRGCCCRTWFRRRPLVTALQHPAGHLYPREVEYTPPPSPEPGRRRHWQVPVSVQLPDDTAEPPLLLEEDTLDPNLGWLGTESHYQQGPDTFLVQLRDTGLPSRLREYVKIACQRSPYLATRALEDPVHDHSLPLLHERRRFTDIMDEEMDEGRRCRINKYSADPSGQYIPKRLRYDVPGRDTALGDTEAALELQRQRQMPFFRERPWDTAIMEGEVCVFYCLAVGDPKPVVQWFRNDVVLGDSKRMRMYQTIDGHSILEMTRVMDFDQGVYKAVARNSVGQTVAKWRVYMGDVPGPVDMPEVTDYSDTEVMLRWKTPYHAGNAPVIAYGLQMKQLIDHVWTEVADNINHEFLCVRDLRPESNYHFRLRALNRFGWGPLSVPTPTCRTRKAGWTRKVELGKAERFLQDMTELGVEPIDPSMQEPLDYDTEDFPVTLTPNSPEQKYTFLSELHRGRMSLVAMCVDTTSSQACAAKVLDATGDNFSAAVAEFEALRSLRHQRVAALYDAYRMDDKLVLAMERLDGTDVLSYFQQQHEYSEDMVAAAIIQILEGLQYIHWRGMVHLDLQPDNVVLASRRCFSFKLVDMGRCQKISKLGRMVQFSQATPYTAPELLVDEPAFPSSDVWSLGVLTYVLLSGLCPFAGDTDDATRQNVLYVRAHVEHLYQEVTTEASRFLTLIFRRGPSKRPTCDECLEHRWLSSNEYMLKRRQRAMFFGNRLKEYSDRYHGERSKLATQNSDIIASFGMDLLS